MGGGTHESMRARSEFQKAVARLSLPEAARRGEWRAKNFGAVVTPFAVSILGSDPFLFSTTHQCG